MALHNMVLEHIIYDIKTASRKTQTNISTMTVKRQNRMSNIMSKKKSKVAKFLN